MRTSKRLLRFGAVGVVNTVIDLVLYVALRALGLPLLMANGISTTCGLVFSLVANHRFTFRDRVNRPRRTVPLFIVVTVFGLWGLQPLAIAASQAWLVPLVGLDPGTPLASGLAKLAGIAVNVAWNFVVYDRLVFADPDPQQRLRSGRA